jgi:hypothetical protein
MSSVDPWKYFSQTKLKILVTLPPRPNVSEFRSESSSARSASNLLTVDSTDHPKKTRCHPLNLSQWGEYNPKLGGPFVAGPGRRPHLIGAIERERLALEPRDAPRPPLKDGDKLLFLKRLPASHDPPRLKSVTLFHCYLTSFAV